MKGIFKSKYGAALKGHVNWFAVLSDEDKAYFLEELHRAALWGHLGGVKRARWANREHGRFARNLTEDEIADLCEKGLDECERFKAEVAEFGWPELRTPAQIDAEEAEYWSKYFSPLSSADHQQFMETLSDSTTIQ